VQPSFKEKGFKAYAVECDVSDYVSIKQAIEFAVEKTGSIDILVNNAGVIDPLTTLVDSDPEVWANAADVNYKGVYFGMRAAIPQMLMKKIRDAKINPVSNLDWDSHLPPESVGEGVAFLCTEKGAEFDGTDFSLKTDEGRKLVGLA